MSDRLEKIETILNGLSTSDLYDLLEDIGLYSEEELVNIILKNVDDDSIAMALEDMGYAMEDD